MDKGMLTGKITVENSYIKSLIESNLPQIKESLKNQDFNVSGFTVSVGLGEGGFSSKQSFSSNKWSFDRKTGKKAESLNQIGEVRVEHSYIGNRALNFLV
jgi:flagellar hook-length control protein FliK